MQAFFHDLHAMFFDVTLVTSPVFLAVAIAGAWWVYHQTGLQGGFWRWLVPMKFYLHPSHLIDLQLFVITRAMAGLGMFGLVTFTTLIAAFVAQQMPGPAIYAQSLSPIFLALLLWLPSDFANYWMHRLFHSWSWLWPLHAVHHSAEVLTPLTTYRQHPLGTVIAIAVQSAVIGAIQGVLVGNLSPSTTGATLAGTNAFFVIANAAFSALHHSHVWLTYGPILERVVISPAQHQIHHSTNIAHHDKNFGNTLAIWDWMFATLYVIDGREAVLFGLTSEDDAALKQQKLSIILLQPLKRMMTRLQS